MRIWLAYLAIGVIVAVFCHFRLRESSRAAKLTSLALSLCAWPLFGPLALLTSREPPLTAKSAITLRIEAALGEARGAIRDTALEGLLPETLVAQLFASLAHVEKRHREIGSLLLRPDFRASTESGARLQKDSLHRLQQLYERDRAMLNEMVELAEALRTQLFVARYSGQDGERGERDVRGVNELALDLAARVDSLREWFELDSTTSSVDTAANARC